jgi:thiol-disulfide isomerase/thioredoxin
MRARLSLLSVVAALAALACAARTREGVHAQRGATDFHDVPLAGVGGGASTLSAVLGRRPALVSFWAPWCEPCVRELPDLERLARALSPCGVTVVGVAVGERPDAIAEFSRQRGLTYPQFTDEQFQLTDALGQRRIPTTIVFDSAQRVVFAGDALDKRATAALAQLLNEPTRAAGCALP